MIIPDGQCGPPGFFYLFPLRAFSERFYILHRQHAVGHGEAHVLPREGHAVHARGIVLIRRARVEREHAAQGRALFLRHERLQLRREHHLHRVIGLRRGEAAERVRMAVRQRMIGLDVQDRRAVHQVGAAHQQRHAVRAVRLHALQRHAGQPDGVRAERRARGEHAHARVAAQPRRAHRRRPALPLVFGKQPDQPQVRKALDPPQGVRVVIRRLEHHARPRLRHKAALARDAELLRKVAADARDNVHLPHGSSTCGTFTPESCIVWSMWRCAALRARSLSPSAMPRYISRWHWLAR